MGVSWKKCKKNCCFITMCKAHSKVTHMKQQKYFHHLKRPGYNTDFLLYPRPFRWWKYFCCFICVTLLWALHIVIKQQFFYIYKILTRQNDATVISLKLALNQSPDKVNQAMIISFKLTFSLRSKKICCVVW